jgi:hypothetical protein
MVVVAGVCQVKKIVDRDELDGNIVEAPVRDPALIGIEILSSPAHGSMDRYRGKVAPFCNSAFFHVSSFLMPSIARPGDAADAST